MAIYATKLDRVDQDAATTGNPLIDGVTRAWDLLVQQVDELLGWSPLAPEPDARTPAALSDSELREAMSRAAAALVAAIAQGRPLSPAAEAAEADQRWRFNLPATVEAHVLAMFTEADDAFRLAISSLADQASPAALAPAGRLAEILAQIRWLLEPAGADERRERGYALTAEAIDRLQAASEYAEEAGDDDAAGLAGEIADRTETMAARLAELREEDGLAALRVPKRRKLLRSHLPGGGLELFAVLSAAGPAAVAPSALFYAERGTRDPLRGFQRLHLTRAFWLAHAFTWYAGICEAAAPVLRHAEWADATAAARARFGALTQEAARRYQERVGRGLHPGL
jgi:hypothetical protein